MSQAPGDQRTQLDYIPEPSGMFGGLTSAQVIRPLWIIFAGGLIYCVTFGILVASGSHNAFSVHLADQPIGAVLMALGVWQLGRVDIDREYMLLMRFILIVAILRIIATTADFFPLPKDPLIDLVHAIFGLASTAAALAFCTAMRWFCQDVGLQRSAKGWLKTTIVFCCACVPLALFQSIGLLVVLKVVQLKSISDSSAIASGWFPLVFLFILAPALAFLLSIMQMRGQMMRREVA